MRTPRTLLALIGLALLTAGCGGGGSNGGGGDPPNETTRQRVRSLLGGSQAAMLQSGFQTSEQAGSANDDASGSSPMMMIGSFVRGMGSMAMGASPPSGGGDHDDGGGEDWNPDFYFDEYLALWVENQNSENEWNMLLWEDEAKTKPAGSFRTVFDSKDSYPLRYLSTYEITAGPMAGTNGRYEVNQLDEMSGTMVYSSHWPGFGSDEGESTWNRDGYHWRSSTNLEDDTWYRHEGSFQSDGSGTSVSENSEGFKCSYRYNADGSGSGLIEGPAPGLPAKVSWRDGKYRIEYADGTVEEWDMYGVVSDVVGSGTSGGGSSGSGGSDGGDRP